MRESKGSSSRSFCKYHFLLLGDIMKASCRDSKGQEHKHPSKKRQMTLSYVKPTKLWNCKNSNQKGYNFPMKESENELETWYTLSMVFSTTKGKLEKAAFVLPSLESTLVHSENTSIWQNACCFPHTIFSRAAWDWQWWFCPSRGYQVKYEVKVLLHSQPCWNVVEG